MSSMTCFLGLFNDAISNLAIIFVASNGRMIVNDEVWREAVIAYFR